MPSFDVQIRMADSSEPGVDPAKLVVSHHLVDRAEVRAEVLSGGHLMHLAVAGCLFNDILRTAGARGIELTDLEISADGDFEGDPLLSTGVSYSVDIAGDAPDEDLRRLVADCEGPAAIPRSIERGTPVRLADVRVRRRD